jgi:aspartyl-tRNA(Asn)/glutamyl-tRNA(Gln) amidotransferase subunit B
MNQYGCSLNHARTLTNELKLANFFENVVAADPGGRSPFAATWIADTLIGELNYRSMSLDNVDTGGFSELLTFLKQCIITDKSGVEVLRLMLDQTLNNQPIEKPSVIVKRLNLTKATGDSDALVAVIRETLAENPKAVEDYLNGRGASANYIVGQVMKKTRGKADPGELNRLVILALKQRGA